MNVHRDRDRLLQLLILNEEFLVNASQQLALITSLPFVHTARRTYRLNGSVRSQDRGLAPSLELCRENLPKPHRQRQVGSLAGAAHLLNDNTGVLRLAQ